MQDTVLFVDARNALYRAIYAVKHDQRPHVTKYHYVVALVRQINGWMHKFDPTSIHIFWDAPRKDVWRRDICPTYKQRENNQYIEDISEDLSISQIAAKAVFEHMNVRQYHRDRMEADDLIYAACTVLNRHNIKIVTTDSDMTQIQCLFDHVKVYDPQKDLVLDRPSLNPAIQKSITGDKTDTIDGYHGIGPKRSAALMSDHTELYAFFELKGMKQFVKNLQLIDLSLCPYLMMNKLYVMKKLAKRPRFDKKAIIDSAQKYKVFGLESEYANIVSPFHNLKVL